MSEKTQAAIEEQNEHIELARRAVRSAAWAWLPDTVLMPLPETLPDFGRPATMGCALHLVRLAFNDPLASLAARSLKEWAIVICPDSAGTYMKFVGRSEAECLVAALEAAPGGIRKHPVSSGAECEGCCQQCNDSLRRDI